jgi:hypothetical protein
VCWASASRAPLRINAKPGRSAAWGCASRAVVAVAPNARSARCAASTIAALVARATTTAAPTPSAAAASAPPATAAPLTTAWARPVSITVALRAPRTRSARSACSAAPRRDAAWCRA